jgi:hypothetical protein
LSTFVGSFLIAYRKALAEPVGLRRPGFQFLQAQYIGAQRSRLFGLTLFVLPEVRVFLFAGGYQFRRNRRQWLVSVWRLWRAAHDRVNAVVPQSIPLPGVALHEAGILARLDDLLAGSRGPFRRLGSYRQREPKNEASLDFHVALLP